VFIDEEMTVLTVENISAFAVAQTKSGETSTLIIPKKIVT
tara:strand:- start:398 stop:517 length:120 start_codon:yes stop_codon:yes gene_type:complete